MRQFLTIATNAFMELWRSQPHRDITFRYGYPDVNHHGHLMVTRKAPAEAPIAAERVIDDEEGGLIGLPPSDIGECTWPSATTARSSPPRGLGTSIAM
jgi:hypothetical protein